MNTEKANDIDEYISRCPEPVKKKLEQVRATIHKAAPDAVETISYSMPAFKQKKIVVYFASFNNHIGLFPTASGIEAFKDEFSDYKWSKGAVQFPLDKPMPLDLISRIVKFRVADILKKDKLKIKNSLNRTVS